MKMIERKIGSEVLGSWKDERTRTADAANTAIRLGQRLREVDVDAVVVSHAIDLLNDCRPIRVDFGAPMTSIRTQTTDEIDFIWRWVVRDVIFVVDVRLVRPDQFAAPHKRACALLNERDRSVATSGTCADNGSPSKWIRDFDQTSLIGLQWNRPYSIESNRETSTD